MPNHNFVRVPRAHGDQSIHARAIITFMFQEHAVDQSIQAQTIQTFVFQAHTVTRASMPTAKLCRTNSRRRQLLWTSRGWKHPQTERPSQSRKKRLRNMRKNTPRMHRKSSHFLRNPYPRPLLATELLPL